MRKANEFFFNEKGALLIVIIISLVMAASGAALLTNIYSSMIEGHWSSLSAYQAQLLAESGVRYARHVVLRDMKNHIYSSATLSDLDNQTFTLSPASDGSSFSIKVNENSGLVTVKSIGITTDAECGWVTGAVINTSSSKPPVHSAPEPDGEPAPPSNPVPTAGGTYVPSDRWGVNGTSLGDYEPADGNWDGNNNH